MNESDVIRDVITIFDSSLKKTCMAVRKWEQRVTYTDDKTFIKEVDEHIEEYDDLRSRNDLLKKAVRQFLGSRRNKGKFKRIR